jgi:hypothetical protein
VSKTKYGMLIEIVPGDGVVGAVIEIPLWL